MLQEIIQTRQFKVVGAIIAVATLLLVLFGLVTKTDSFTLHKLPIRSDGVTAQLKGDDLYIFNGASFYSVSTTNNQPPRIYASGMRLPTPSSIVWLGDTGALMTFSGSFVHTPVLDQIIDGKIDYDQAENATWYFDFTSKQLSLIDTSPLHQNEGYYNKSTKTAYFFVQNDSSNVSELRSYSFSSKKVSDVKNANSLANPQATGQCPKSKAGDFCFVSKSSVGTDTTSLYSFKNNTIQPVLTVRGEIIPTGRPSTYVILNRSDLSTDIDGEDDSGVLTYKKQIVYNLDTNKKIAIDRDLTSDSVLASSYNTTDTVLFSTGDNKYTVANGTIFGTKVVNKTTDETSTTNAVQPGNGELLIRGVGDSAYLFSRRGSPSQYLEVQSLNTDIKKCFSNNEITTDPYKSVTFYINDDNNFNSTVRSISDCLNKKPELLTNYTVIFASINPESKRITSD